MFVDQVRIHGHALLTGSYKELIDCGNDIDELEDVSELWHRLLENILFFVAKQQFLQVAEEIQRRSHTLRPKDTAGTWQAHEQTEIRKKMFKSIQNERTYKSLEGPGSGETPAVLQQNFKLLKNIQEL